MGLDIEIVTLSRQGGREYNEDVLGHWNNGQFIACLVADGAGGHGGGDVAAAIVRSSVIDGFAEAPSLAPQNLHALLMQANAAVVARQAEGGALAHMRSTAVVALLDVEQGELLWGHSGDSRAYLFRDNMIAARTLDHSLVQQMVAGGLLDEEGARLHPQRNVLLSALGSADEPPSIDISERMRLRGGDVLLLCSDGVWEVLGDEGLLNILHSVGSAGQCLQRLDEQVRARAKPGHDNYTALLVWTSLADDDQTRLLPDPVAAM